MFITREIRKFGNSLIHSLATLLSDGFKIDFQYSKKPPSDPSKEAIFKFAAV